MLTIRCNLESQSLSQSRQRQKRFANRILTKITIFNAFFIIQFILQSIILLLSCITLYSMKLLTFSNLGPVLGSHLRERERDSIAYLSCSLSLSLRERGVFPSRSSFNSTFFFFPFFLLDEIYVHNKHAKGTEGRRGRWIRWYCIGVLHTHVDI